MMLGKRGRRPPMKRTTSMTEFAWDLNGGGAADGHVHHQPPLDLNIPYNGGGSDQKHVAAPAQRRNSADLVVESGSFLRMCSLCKRRLIPGRDIFMYRGDSAFCSVECREKQMIQDERKDKYSVASKMEVAGAAAAAKRVPAV